MERELLRRVQLTQLEITKEIKRVCEENNIRYFITAGSFLGAVRHQGFIPWDDDMDVGMLRSDYEKFCRIAPKKLNPQYTFQNWYTDPNYSLPFGKVLKRNTLYLEDYKTVKLKENGIYVDVFPYDDVPEDPFERAALTRNLVSIFRTKLMKSGYAPWRRDGVINWRKRIGYVYYQAKSLFVSQNELARAYDALAVAPRESSLVCEQMGKPKPVFCKRRVLEELADYTFEGVTFKGPKDYDSYLTDAYGDYMTPPPEDQRENRHQIVKVDFGPEDQEQ